MSSKVCRVVVIVMLLCVVGFVATVLTQTRAEQGAATGVTEEAKKPTIEKPTIEKPTLEQRMDAFEKSQNQILAELKQIRQTQDEIIQMTQKIFTYMKRK
jgi:TolA-binding protein